MRTLLAQSCEREVLGSPVAPRSSAMLEQLQGGNWAVLHFLPAGSSALALGNAATPLNYNQMQLPSLPLRKERVCHQGRGHSVGKAI